MAESIKILEKLLNQLSKYSSDASNEADMNEIITTLLSPLMKILIEFMKNENPLCGTLNTIVLEIFRNMDEKHYIMYQRLNFQTIIVVQDFIHVATKLFCSMIRQPVYPKDWVILILHQRRVILRSLNLMYSIMVQNFKNPFSARGWICFFETYFELMNQPEPDLKQYPAGKRGGFLQTFADDKRSATISIFELWAELGEHKRKLVLELIDPVLEMSMDPDPVVRQKSIQTFGDMIQCTVAANSDEDQSPSDVYKLFQVESATLNKFDLLIESGKGDCEYVDRFKEVMLMAVQGNEAVLALVTKFNLYLEQLLQYHFYKSGEENMMRSIVKLLELTRDSKQYDLYLRYIYRLHGIHIKRNNKAEAAMTLKMHADLLKWDNIIVAPVCR